VDVEVGGVDRQVGLAAQVGEDLPLPLESVEQPATGLQRVRPPGRLLAPDQNVVGRLQEDQRRVAIADLALGQVGTTAIGCLRPRLSSTSRTTSLSRLGGRLSTT